MDERLDKLGIPAPQPWRKWVLRIGLVVVAVGAIGGGLLYYRGRGATGPRFETTPIARGELVATVSATGTLRPRNTVEVGPEISGRVAAVHVEENQRVTAGQVLAEIDTTQIEAQVATARANLASSVASVRLARVALEDARNVLRRTEQLHARQLASDAELDQARAAVARAEAEVAAGGARTGVARAELDRVSSDLGRARVVSPIDGVVLVRNVDPGQSVAATLSSPVFFQIAEDLSELELTVDIDEADVGRVREEMEATFRVDAYADREFRATIRRLHLAARTVANVVTYPADLRVDNADGLLRPGMTATATIVCERRPDQILVPNAALRFVPPAEQRFGPPRRQSATEPTIWVLRDGRAHPITVHTLGTDGRNTAISGDGVAEGLPVITGLARESLEDPAS
ncbi:MAG: efflux RND transporter periplasmic adaptor subunit [Sandaracinaceae bacterium]